MDLFKTNLYAEFLGRSLCLNKTKPSPFFFLFVSMKTQNDNDDADNLTQFKLNLL